MGSTAFSLGYPTTTDEAEGGESNGHVNGRTSGWWVNPIKVNPRPMVNGHRNRAMGQLLMVVKWVVSLKVPTSNTDF